MKLLNYMERIQRMHLLISARNTGTPMEFSKRMNISVSRLSRIIEELKLMGAPICYDRKLKTYFYEEPYEIELICRFYKITEN
jgi:predicted DNA-binding transcriptional regulator YafY